MGHVLGLDEGVEFFGGDEAELDGGFAEAHAFLVRDLGDFGGIVIADFRSEGGDEHQGIVDVAIELLAVDCDAADAMFDEAVAGVGEQFHGVQIIKNHHGLEDV